MSLLLRPTKCLRYLTRTGTARGLALPSARSIRSLALCNNEEHTSTTKWARHYSSYRASIQPLLSRLDEEVRRFGRISRKDVDELLIGVQAHELTSAQCLLVIRCCGELVPEETPERRTQLVQSIWKALNDRNVPVDISHYNALLRVYLENEHPFSPAEFLDELEKKGIEPNRVTYQRLMWRYCQAGDVDGATRVLEKMRELGLPVSEPVLNALVMGHAFHGDAEGARAVLDTMAGAGLQPSGRTYALLASGHARSGDADGAKAVLKLAEERDTFLTDRDLMELIESAAIGGCHDAVDSLLELMPKAAGYNQDALNLILRLINRGFDDTAVKVHKTLSEAKTLEAKDSTSYRGAFFVKQLVAVGRPVEQLIPLCRRLQEENIVPSALSIATESALQKGDMHTAIQLIRVLRSDGLPIRQHYYWPLLSAATRNNDEEMLMNILRSMSADQLQPSTETLEDYVVPYLLKKYPADTVILKLQGANVVTPRAARGVILTLLGLGKAKEAVKVAQQYRPRGNIPSLLRPLLSCLSKTKDIEAFAKILHAVVDTQAVRDEEIDSQEGEKEDGRNEVSRAVLGAVKVLKDSVLVEQLFTALVERGVGISNQVATKIEEYMGERMTAGVRESLAKLSSPELEPAPAERVARPRGQLQLDAPHLEMLLARAREQGKPTLSLSRQLMTAYVEANDEAKLTNFLKQLEAEQFVLTGSTLAQLIEFYCEYDVDKALAYRNQLLEREPDFLLTKFKVIKLALALVKADRLNEALEQLKLPKLDKEENESYGYNNLCWQVLNHLAENKEKEDVRVVLEAIVSNGFSEPTNGLLGSLVKVHVLKDDMEGALAELEHCCEKYRCTPWKGELLRRLIASEDAARLQRLTDLSTAVHGEVNSLHDLVLAFVECGRLRQARRVLETPGLRTRSHRLTQASQRYLQEGKTECLENLVEATKELSHIDRSEMFFNLLVSYCRAEATDKAVGLWTQLQEQGEIPTEPFLTHLGEYLKSRDLPVPFVMPAPLKPVKSEVKPVSKRNIQEEFTKAIADKDEDTIIGLVRGARRSDNIPRSMYNEAIRMLTKSTRIEEAVKVVEKALELNTVPGIRTLRYLMAVIADSGDEKTLARVGSKLDEKHKFELQYEGKLARARIAGGLGLQHLTSVLASMEAASDEDTLSSATSTFPRGAALAAALDDPEMNTVCDKIIEVAAAKGKMLPASMKWQELIILGREAEARALWERTVRDAPNLMFLRILQEGSNRKDPKIFYTLIDHLKERPSTTSAALARVYSSLLRIYEETEPALAELRAALDAGVELNQIDQSALKSLVEKLHAEGKEFPYELPVDTKKIASSTA